MCIIKNFFFSQKLKCTKFHKCKFGFYILAIAEKSALLNKRYVGTLHVLLPKGYQLIRHSLVLLGKWYNPNLTFKISPGEYVLKPPRGAIKNLTTAQLEQKCASLNFPQNNLWNEHVRA